MDINLMVLNVGNTRLGIGVFMGGELRHVSRVVLDQPGQWEGVLAEAWRKLEGSDKPAIAGASVNPGAVPALEQAVVQCTGRQVEWVGRQIDLPIKVLTDEPGQTGIDRILNIAAAFEQMEKACVVVDAGTAVTVDCCSDKGEFLGGAIAPGASMMLEALHERTARLPQVTFEPPVAAFGQSTEQAMRHGVYHGIRGMVRELVENYATELGFWPDIIATGGDAAKLFEGWELIHAIAPDLTMYGIALAYTEHQIEHG